MKKKKEAAFNHTKLIALSQLVLLIKEKSREFDEKCYSDLFQSLNLLNLYRYCLVKELPEKRFKLELTEKCLERITSKINPEELTPAIFFSGRKSGEDKSKKYSQILFEN